MTMQIIKRLYSSVVKKRFYKSVSVVSSDNLFEVCLDGKKLKTPKFQVIKVPSEPLALAIAQEWDSQLDKINTHSMHLTGLACTAIDNPLQHTTMSIVDAIMQHLENDTLLFFNDSLDGLYKLQHLHWGQTIEWANKYFEANLKPTSSIAPPQISEETKRKVRGHLSSYNLWSLIGYQYAVDALKSVLLTAATVQCQLSAEEAVKMSMLEQEFQVSQWGRVDWAHDVEYYELCSRLAAAVLFVNLNSSTVETKRKL